MIKVITYGTFDMFHYGHENLLKRAKALGDYLIVGVTTENFDLNRGKLNITQTLMERIAAVKESGYADEIIPEEYEGQKIDDIINYDIDIFAIGSDWKGHFDYLNEYCKVIYLERTAGISSTQIRRQQQYISMGVVGWCNSVMPKFIEESKFVCGLSVDKAYIEEDTEDMINMDIEVVNSTYEDFLEEVDAVYIFSSPSRHYRYVKQALMQKKHVLCSTPLTLKAEETKELYKLAEENHIVLCDAIKTAYLRAFNRLILLVKSGIIGEVKMVDATCTSLETSNFWSEDKDQGGGSVTSWAPFALLAIFKLLGVDYKECNYTSLFKNEQGVDLFTKIDLFYDNAIATAKVGIGVKSEGDLIIGGTKAYIYVPSPWWKTDYFEVRYENFTNNRRFFHQLEGEGIRYEQADFMKYIRAQERTHQSVEPEISEAISKVIENFLYKKNFLKRTIR